VQAVVLTKVALAGGVCVCVCVRGALHGWRTANSSYVQQRDPRWHCGYFYVKRFSAQVPGIGLATVEVAFIDTSPWCVRSGVTVAGWLRNDGRLSEMIVGMGPRRPGKF
jgi:hypothetical protein